MNIKSLKKKEFLNFELSDRFIYDNFVVFIKRLGNENSKKIMVDASRLLNTDLSYKVRYDIGKAAAKFLNKDAKYAVVWTEKDINYFAISVMRLQGLNIQIFTKKRQARKWLLNKKTDNNFEK